MKKAAITERGLTGWVNDYTRCPKITGQLEISASRTDIFIGGDPEGLRSLAALLVWLADTDQESLSSQPVGARLHVHLHTRDVEGFNSLTPFSRETEVCRLDAKGTGEFPEKYRRLFREKTRAGGSRTGVKKQGRKRSGKC